MVCYELIKLIGDTGNAVVLKDTRKEEISQKKSPASVNGKTKDINGQLTGMPTRFNHSPSHLKCDKWVNIDI